LQGNQDAIIGRRVDIYHLLVFSRDYSWGAPGTWNNCHKCSLLWHASERTEACNPL
jgi:hypothetical protein